MEQVNFPIKIMAISDTHLGEDCSLLSFPHGRWHLWEVIKSTLGGIPRVKPEVEELIMVGDIPDRCLSSTSQIITNTNDFCQMFGSVVSIKKSVYVIGNHDHTLWTDYYVGGPGHGAKYGINPPSGTSFVGSGNYSPKSFQQEILTILFGYDKGSCWRKILDDANATPPAKSQDFEFIVANPVYATQLKKRTYVFSHGTHFDDFVAWSKKLYWLGHGIRKRIVSWINKFQRVPSHNLENLEKELGPIIDEIWKSSFNNPTPWRGELYFWLCELTGRFGKIREAPSDSALIPWAELYRYSKRINRLTQNNKPLQNSSTARFEKNFLPLLALFLDNTLSKPPQIMTFVSGHTHNGGWGELTTNIKGVTRELHVVDLGGWVVHSKDEHPACHIYIVDNEENEFILDVSFKNVKIDNEYLLDVVQHEAEHRWVRGA